MRGVRGWWRGWTVGCATQTGCVSVRKSPLQRHWESGDDSSRVSSSCLAGLETPVYTTSQNLVTQYQERYKIIKIWQIRFVSAVVQILYLWIIRLRSTLEIKYQTGTKWSKWKMWKLHSSWREENKTKTTMKISIAITAIILSSHNSLGKLSQQKYFLVLHIFIILQAALINFSQTKIFRFNWYIN